MPAKKIVNKQQVARKITPAPSRPIVQQKQQAPAAGLLWPIPGSGKITQLPFDSYSHSRSNALDISAIVGTPVIAPAGGTIRRVSSNVGYGNHVIIDSDFGQIYLAHLSSFVGSGNTVKAGDLIGYSGSTGNSSGAHLHYEIRGSAVGNLKNILGDIGVQTLSSFQPAPGASTLSSISRGLVNTVTTKQASATLQSGISVLGKTTAQVSKSDKTEDESVVVASTPVGDVTVPLPGKKAGRYVLIGVGIIIMVAAAIKWTTNSGVIEGAQKLATKAAVKAASSGVL